MMKTFLMAYVRIVSSSRSRCSGKPCQASLSGRLSVGVEHDAGDHEFDPGRTVDQPLAQGLFLLDIEDASVVGCKIASGTAVGDEPFDITVGELVPVLVQFSVDLPIGAAVRVPGYGWPGITHRRSSHCYIDNRHRTCFCWLASCPRSHDHRGSYKLAGLDINFAICGWEKARDIYEEYP